MWQPFCGALPAHWSLNYLYFRGTQYEGANDFNTQIALIVALILSIATTSTKV